MLKISEKLLIILILSLFINGECVYSITPVQSQLTKIENELWGFSYDKENDAQRIERIEKQIFGIPNPKLTPDKRVEKITKSLGLETYEEAKSSLNDLYVQQEAGEGVEYPQIDALEKTILGKTYAKENIYVRLERLEKKAFGAKQDGELAQRTDALNRYASINLSQNNPQDLYDKAPKGYDSFYSDNSDVKLQLAAIENMVFGMDFSQEPVQLRLSRLENKIFQRNFSDDEDLTRISRIQAAATANKTAKYYDNNKFQKFAATGLQAASLLLMILAFIL